MRPQPWPPFLPPHPTKRRSAGALPNPSSLPSNENKPLSNPPSLLTQLPSLLQPTPSSSGLDPSITKVNSSSKSLDSSPILGQKDPIQFSPASSSSLGERISPLFPPPGVQVCSVMLENSHLQQTHSHL